MLTTRKTLKTYWQHAWKYPSIVVGILFIQPVGVLAFRLIPPLIAATMLERLAGGDFIEGDLWASFGSEIILYALLLLGGGVFTFRIVIYLIWKLEGYVLRDLFNTMFAKYMELSASYHAGNFGGSLVSRTNKLIGSYIRLADTFVFQFYPLLISFVFVSIVMYARSPVFVWSMIGFSFLFVWLTFVLSRKIRQLSDSEARAHNKTTGYLADAITNLMAIKSFSSAGAEEKRFAIATENLRQRTMKLMWATLKRDLFASSITVSIQIMAAVVAVASVVIYGGNAATVFLMLSYATFISDQLWQFSTSTLRNFNRAVGDAQEAIETLSEEPTVKDPAYPEKAKIGSGKVEFCNVYFDHEGDQANSENGLFANFNLKIAPGEKIGLVGHSGSGKTTLTKLLLRFMDIDSGEILIDGQNIANLHQDDLRRSVTYVPQEPLLFHRSLTENISYGKKDATETEVIKAAELAHAHEFIKNLPKKYSTLVGERGVKLSGGQRQRVAIARAMLKDAPILLLDEATSALDSESEVLIQDALWKLMEGKTAIVIAHRLSTIQKMDRIIVMDNGNVAEEGSHLNLLKKNGLYARLWAHQSGGFLEE